jgi:hypothetical protein
MLDEQAFLSFFQAGKDHRDAALAYASRAFFVFPITPHKKSPPLTPHGKNDATTKSDVIKHWFPPGSINNIGIALPPSNIVVIDIDPRHDGDSNFRALVKKYGSLPDTYTVRTAGGGWHYYFKVSPDFYEDTTPYSNNKQLANGVELLINAYVVAPPSEADGNSYVIEDGSPEFEFATLPFNWLDSVIAEKRQSESLWEPDSDDFTIAKGERNNALTAFGGWLRNGSLNEAAIAKCLDGFAEVYIDNYDDDIRREIPIIAHSICRYPPKGVPVYNLGVKIRKVVHKPILDTDVAFHGPLGRWVKLTLSQTEAHPAALLSQALTVFGNMIGAHEHGEIAPGFFAEGARHTTGLYTLIVGESAVAAKGDSLSQVLRFLKPLDPEWPNVTGVQTGEGIIDYLADNRETGEVAKVKHGDTEETVPHVMKGGQADRRLCVIEPEFGRVLQTSKRPGSVTKDVYKSMWDGGSTANITASSKKVVTDATLSFIGHVTPYELHSDVPEGDFLNGYLNRFLFIHSERTQDLPNAQGLKPGKLKILREPLANAIEFARDYAPYVYEFAEDAEDLRDEIRSYWISKRIGDPIIDAMLGRARPQIRRIATVYAVTCEHEQIEEPDLLAANAVFHYHYDSVVFLFNQFIGDPDVNKLARALMANPAGVEWSEVTNKIFSRSNNASKRAQRAVGILVERGIAIVDEIQKPGSHKKTRVVRLVQLLP